MGLFSDKKEYTYTCYATKLYADSKPVVRQTAVSAIAANRNIAECLIANISQGILFNANRLYRYGASGNYHWGLPEGSQSVIPPNVRDNVELVLTNELQKPIYLTSVYVSPDGDGDYIYHAEYYFYKKNGEVDDTLQTWEYNESTEVYPILTLGEVPEESNYYPIIPIRLNKQNLAQRKPLDHPEGEPWYEHDHAKDIRKAAGMLDLKLDDMYDSINEQVKDAGRNPPEDMYILLGVSVSADTPRTNEYLFKYFSALHLESRIKQEDYDYWKANHSTDGKDVIAPENKVTIKDSQYHATIGWDFINKNVFTGSDKPVGTFSVAYDKYLGRVDNEGRQESAQLLYVRHQITENQYVELKIQGLVHRNLVVSKKWVSIDLENAFEDPEGATDGECFIIPLRLDICKEMGPIKSHDLMYEAIRLLTCDEDYHVVKWYQSGFFKFLVLVVAVVVSVWFPPAGVAAWSFAAVGYALLNVAISMLVMPLIMKGLSDVLGEELALLVVVIATLFGVGLSDAGGSISITTSAPTLASAFFATTLTISGTLGLKSIDLQEEMKLIEEEHKELLKLMDVLYEEEFKSAVDTNEMINLISDDPYGIMGASNYVTMTRMAMDKPRLLTKTTELFTQVKKSTDIPDSYIRLGV